MTVRAFEIAPEETARFDAPRGPGARPRGITRATRPGVGARATRHAPSRVRGRGPERDSRASREPASAGADDRRFEAERALGFFQPPNAGNRRVRPSSLGAPVLTATPRTPITACGSSRALVRTRRGGPRARSRARRRALRLRLGRIGCVNNLVMFRATRAFRAISRTHWHDRSRERESIPPVDTAATTRNTHVFTPSPRAQAPPASLALAPSSRCVPPAQVASPDADASPARGKEERSRTRSKCARRRAGGPNSGGRAATSDDRAEIFLFRSRTLCFVAHLTRFVSVLTKKNKKRRLAARWW